MENRGKVGEGESLHEGCRMRSAWKENSETRRDGE